MSERPERDAARTNEEEGIHRVVADDLRRLRFRRDYLQEFKDLYLFYVDDDRRAELARMGRVRRAFTLLWWILRSTYLKLSPARRLMVLAALAFELMGQHNLDLTVWHVRLDADLRPIGFVILLVVLMLELRDKLLAKDEIAVARQVQIALLPRSQPSVPGWSVWSTSRPANDVGGDLVDYIEVDAFRHAVVVADVAGKGLGAALLSAKLQATLRALVPNSVTLDELGARVNDIFHRDGLDNRYATLFYVELDHSSGNLRYLNAGHNPPILLGAAGIVRLAASSYPLGMLSSAVYREEALELGPGDLILAYSDGLTEARNVHGEEFGMERLEALLLALRGLPPSAVGAKLLEEVDRFLGDSRLEDDLSLVAIARRPVQSP